MGEFSFMFADKANKKNLKSGEPCYVACPDGSYIFDDGYDGYGHFNGRDIYELVVDWNRDLLDTSMLQKPTREMYGSDPDSQKWYENGMRIYEKSKNCLLAWKSGDYTATEMAENFGKEWKRNLGIDISCYDEQNAALPYPIKIVSKPGIPYDKLPSSDGDPEQGW